MMCVRWVSTVRSERKSLSAIAGLVIPAATSPAISISRRLKPCAGLCGVPDRELKCSRTSTWRASTVSLPPLAHAASDSFSDSADRASRTPLSTRGPHGCLATGKASGVRSLAAALKSRSAYRGSVSAIAHPIPATWSVVDRVSPRSTSSSPARKAASAFSRVPKSNSR